MNPPSARAAAARLVCLASLGVRGLLEEEIDNTEPAEALEARARIQELLECLKSVRTLGRPSLQESQAMAKPIGGWSARERVNASWRVESAGVIAWSLGLLGEIPAYDTRFCSLDIAEVIPRTGESTRAFVRMAALGQRAKLGRHGKQPKRGCGGHERRRYRLTKTSTRVRLRRRSTRSTFARLPGRARQTAGSLPSTRTFPLSGKRTRTCLLRSIARRRALPRKGFGA